MGNLKLFSLVCVLCVSAGVLFDNSLVAASDIELDNGKAEPIEENQLYAFLDPRSSLTFEQMLEILKSEVDEKDDGTKPYEIFYRELPEHPGPKLSDLIEAATYSQEKCTEAHFRQLVAWRQHHGQQVPLAGYLRTLIKDQRRFCDEFLNEATSAEVASFDESTKAHFELFLQQDRVGQDFYVSPDSAITKLRSLIGEPKSVRAQIESAQLISQSGQNFLTACQEITTKLGPLEPIRRDHEIFARLPLRHENYFRAYNFCHNLVDFDFPKELQNILYLDVHSRNSISEFGSYLVRKNLPEGQASVSDDDHKEIPKAAVKYAVRLASKSQMNEKEALEEGIVHLMRSCTASLDLAENLLWLRKHDLKGLRTNQLDKRARHYLKALSACYELIRLEVPEILEQGLEGNSANDRDKERNRARHSSNPFVNLFRRLMGKA